MDIHPLPGLSSVEDDRKYPHSEAFWRYWRLGLQHVNLGGHYPTHDSLLLFCWSGLGREWPMVSLPHPHQCRTIEVDNVWVRCSPRSAIWAALPKPQNVLWLCLPSLTKGAEAQVQMVWCTDRRGVAQSLGRAGRKVSFPMPFAQKCAHTPSRLPHPPSFLLSTFFPHLIPSALGFQDWLHSSCTATEVAVWHLSRVLHFVHSVPNIHRYLISPSWYPFWGAISTTPILQERQVRPWEWRNSLGFEPRDSQPQGMVVASWCACRSLQNTRAKVQVQLPLSPALRSPWSSQSPGQAGPRPRAGSLDQHLWVHGILTDNRSAGLAQVRDVSLSLKGQNFTAKLVSHWLLSWASRQEVPPFEGLPRAESNFCLQICAISVPGWRVSGPTAESGCD